MIDIDNIGIRITINRQQAIDRIDCAAVEPIRFNHCTLRITAHINNVISSTGIDRRCGTNRLNINNVTSSTGIDRCYVTNRLNINDVITRTQIKIEFFDREIFNTLVR